MADTLLKALNRLLDKSQELTNELEEISATNPFNEEAKKALKGVKDLKTKLIKLQKEDNTYKKLEEQKAQKEKELETLTDNYLKKTGGYDKEKLQGKLEEILKAQKDGGSYANDCKEKIIKKLISKTKITKEELNNLCKLQEEIIKLTIQLEETNKQEEKQLTQIINNIGNINVTQGNVLVDNTFGDNANITSHYTTNTNKQGIMIEGDNNNLTNVLVSKNTIEQNKYVNIEQPNIFSWQNIHSNFTPDLIQSWKNLNFTPQQTQEWINIGLTPRDYNFANWLKNQKNLTPEQTLNNHNSEVLRQEFLQSQLINKNSQNFPVKTSQLKTETKEITLELKKTEKQLQSYYENAKPDSAEIIRNFIEINKKFMKNEKDDQARENTKEFYGKLKSSKSSEKIEQIIEDCEKLVGLELLLEEKQKEIQNLEKNQQNIETIQAQIIHNLPRRR